MLNLKAVENIVKEQTKNPESICHDFGHLKRTAEGAKWFVRVSGGNEHEQQLAWIAGLLHDIVGPTTKKVDHALPSAEKAKNILEQLNFSQADIAEVYRAIKDHSTKAIINWQSLVHESIFFADKMFEQFGAVIIFRRGMWMAESPDFDWTKASSHDVKSENYEHRAWVYKSEHFPKRFRKLFEYQFKWVADALEAFKTKKPWAMNIDAKSFAAGKQRIHSEDFIKGYNPISAEDARYKEESLAYIEGKLFEKFESMIRH